MDVPSELLQKLNNLHRTHQPLLVGIDGYGGSGKTTIAKCIQKNLTNVTIVEMDDFYSSTLRRADYNRVNQQVLKPLSNKRSASYQIYNWKSDTLSESRNIEPCGIVIIEGVYSTHPDIAINYNFKIWIDCDPEIAARRGIARDKVRDNIDNTDTWLRIWLPQEKNTLKLRVLLNMRIIF